MGKKPIQVLIVDDSPVDREHLAHILGSDPDIEIAGIALDGSQAVQAVMREKPDVILMDLHLPKMSGFEASRIIMETRPVPIIIVSSSTRAGSESYLFQALETGALTLAKKPAGPSHPAHAAEAMALIETVKLMSEIKLVTRRARVRTEPAPASPREPVTVAQGQIAIVALGTSAGGPPALRTILAGLPKNFPVPVLIVQHIAAGFVESMAEWLRQSTGFPVQIAARDEFPLPGHAYLAPDNFHMGVDQRGHITLVGSSPEQRICPSVAHLFRSVACAFGPRSVGVLLTGMGCDGAAELKLMREKGAVTVAQDQASSMVHGMPGEAIKLGAASQVLALDDIAPFLTRLIVGGE